MGCFRFSMGRRFYSFDLAPGNFDDTIVAEDGEDATDDNAILLDIDVLTEEEFLKMMKKLYGTILTK